MKAFRFNLQRVLSYRETIEDALMAELAAIGREYEHEVGRLQQMRLAREAFRERMKHKLEQGDPEVIRRAHGYLVLLSERIDEQEEIVCEVRRKKDDKTAEVVAASKDRQILDRLKEIKAGEHRLEMLSEEQRFLDELAGVRHRPNADVHPA